uniref:Interleukin family protein n=1 Tax=Mola mola TaxID=94237 RepID=A0A3Q4ANB6_MOLML
SALMKNQTSACLLLLLICLGEVTQGRHLLLNACSVNVHTQELHKYYSHIRSNAVSSMQHPTLFFMINFVFQEGQTCCFLRLVLRFYVERVFGNYASSQPQHQRSSSALANAFVSIRRDMHKCHCHCTEETQRTVDSLDAAFNKLDMNKAAQKAVGELDTVLDWLEGLSQKKTVS